MTQGGACRTVGFATATTSTLTIGSFFLNMYDRANKQMVRRGLATKTLDPKASPRPAAETMKEELALVERLAGAKRGAQSAERTEQEL